MKLIESNNIGASDIAETLGCTTEAASEKLSGEMITTDEAFKIRDKHFPDKTVDFLFSEE